MTTSQIFGEIANCLTRAMNTVSKAANDDPMSQVVAPYQIAETTLLLFKQELEKVAKHEQLHEALDGQE